MHSDPIEAGLLPPSEAAAPGGFAAMTAKSFPARILVIDDDAQIREIIASLLTGSGFRVVRAGDGEAGWKACCAQRFDLLITDHEMPNLTGLELMRRVRAVSHSLPAILISGFAPWGEADLEWLFQPGAVLEKPFSFAVLLAKVRELLGEHPVAAAAVSNGKLHLSLREN